MSIYGSYYFVTIEIDNDMVLLVAWNSYMDVMSILKHIRTPLQKNNYKHFENDVTGCINIQGFKITILHKFQNWSFVMEYTFSLYIMSTYYLSSFIAI